MQSTHKEIYQRAAEDSGLSLESIKLVGDIIFKEWANNLKEPEKIILKIKKVGRMYLRKNRLTDLCIKMNNSIRNADEPKGEDKFLSLEEKAYLLDLYEDRLIEYNKYVEKKKKIQTLRYPVQGIITPIDRSNDME